MKDRYVYPALFSFDNDGITITFPDLPDCFTCGNTLEEALYMAKDCLELHLYALESANKNIPEPSKFTDFKVNANETIVLVDVWMIPVRDEMANKSVKKTLTIPKWLNDIAEKKHVNYSHILQTGLKSYLGVVEPHY